MVWDRFVVIVPGSKVEDALTVKLALFTGFDVLNETILLTCPKSQVIKTEGSGVPLELPLITPPPTDQYMVIPPFQFPEIVYWYCTPGVIQVGPEIEI